MLALLLLLLYTANPFIPATATITALTTTAVNALSIKNKSLKF